LALLLALWRSGDTRLDATDLPAWSRASIEARMSFAVVTTLWAVAAITSLSPAPQRAT
jgi:hypothetical protein